MRSKQFRDNTILDLGLGNTLGIACDSSASIGQKPCDAVDVDPEITAACCLRVPLFELICIGAEPICIIDVIGNEMKPTGEKMLKGIKKEMKQANIENVPINGSTEENMLTKMSSLGITVIGKFPNKFVEPTIGKGDFLFRLGTPLIGQEVVDNLGDLCSYSELYELKNEVGVLDMLPVGSKGIQFESKEMADFNQLKIHLTESKSDVLTKSAGPATVVLVAVAVKYKENIIQKYPHLTEVGQFK